MDLSFVYNKNRWRMFIVYSQNVEESLKVIMEEVKVRENEEEYLIIEGDLNARTGNEGGPIGNGERKEEEIRRLKDKIINREGRILIDKIKERGWMILNGSYGREGEWTYIGEIGLSVIDYVISNEKAMEEVIKVEEGNRTESDHVPVEVELVGRIRKRRGISDIIEKERSLWSEEGIEYYHERCKDWICIQEKTEEIWRELQEKVKDSIKKVKKKIIL